MFKTFQLAILAVTLCLSSALAANHDFIKVKGGGTVVGVNINNTPPPPYVTGRFTANVTRVDIVAKEDHIIKGSISINSEKAGPVDPIYGVDVEANFSVDAVRVFAKHPDVVWVHGFADAGSFIRIGTYFGGNFTPIPINGCPGEFVAAFTSWGEAHIISIETTPENIALMQNFCNLPEEGSEESLISLVGGFDHIMLRNGDLPGKFYIETPRHRDMTVGCPISTNCIP
jgi:hypothetical protein